MSSPSSVGFIGLGIMGFPMAMKLAEKLPESTSLHIFDVSKESLQRFEKEAKRPIGICSSGKEVAEKSDIIFTVVPEGSHVRAVYLGNNGVLSANVETKILVDCSTIDTATSQAVRAEVNNKFPTASFYDAPISGGSLGAAAGTLTFMLGCAEDDENLPLLKQLIGMMGTSIFPCGGPSLGLTAKLCNNYCSGLIAIATAEAMNIAIKSGMDPRVLAKVFSTSTAQSTISDKWNPVPGVVPTAPASKGYAGGFKVQLMRKDFALAVEAAEKVQAKLELGQAGLQTYTNASNDPKCKDLDSRVVFRYIGGDEEWLGNLPASTS